MYLVGLGSVTMVLRTILSTSAEPNTTNEAQDVHCVTKTGRVIPSPPTLLCEPLTMSQHCGAPSTALTNHPALDTKTICAILSSCHICVGKKSSTPRGQSETTAVSRLAKNKRNRRTTQAFCKLRALARVMSVVQSACLCPASGTLRNSIPSKTSTGHWPPFFALKAIACCLYVFRTVSRLSVGGEICR